MSEALLLSVMQRLQNYRKHNSPSNEDETDDEVKTDVRMEWVIKEMREIVDVVRDEKLEEGRTLNFLASDLVDMADDALDLFSQHKCNGWTEWIIDGNGLSVLIKGMDGIGKTTLAREIFNHPIVIEEFDCRAWVSNSTYFTMKELLIKVIQQLEDPESLHTSSSLENMDNRSLRDMLSQHLQGRQYLIVLDDVPKQMRLKPFLKALPNQRNGSRLLLTSHTTQVDIKVHDANVYKMKPLDSNKSWQLFLKTINHGNKLAGDHKFPVSLNYMGKQMLRKCGGLPLAIKEVGKQLVEKKRSGGGEWEQLIESVDFGSTLKLFEPFYHKLDPKLRSCFLSMAFFKENTTLRKEKLKLIWVIGGVVVHDSGYECEQNLEDLVNESFINVNDKGTKYHMNVVLHMLSIQKAQEKLGFEMLRNNGNNRPSESPRHHRVIICSRDMFNYSTDQDKHLVSLFFHGGGYLDTSPSYWKSFEQLKILDLEDFGLKFLPESICTLMELRYLGLRNNYIKELPQSLWFLEKLEVLDIAQNFMVEVPNIIWGMHSLHHLYMSDVIYRKPLKIVNIWIMTTLTYVSVDNWTYDLSDLKFGCLKKLGIEELDGNADVCKLFESLAESTFLEHLILRGYRFKSMPCLDELHILHRVRTLKLDGLLARLPRSFPRSLESLTLVNSCLDEDPMPLLGKLRIPSLKYLRLRNAYTGQQMAMSDDCSFPMLRVLCIEELWNLRNLQWGDRYALSRLEKLEIHDCPYLDTLPETNAGMYNLKELKMVTTKSIAAKIKNSHFISKIPMVNINPMNESSWR